MEEQRCRWCLQDQLYIDYHDQVWGKPEYDSVKLFEYLNLEGAQAGLSWYTVLKKMPHYSKVFKGWEPEAILKMDASEREALYTDPGIIRNRLKINAVFTNAEAYMRLSKGKMEFSDYIWSFVQHQPIDNKFTSLDQVPAQTGISRQLSKSLKSHGFKFVGPTITYAFMQAVGMVNDHLLSCPYR